MVNLAEEEVMVENGKLDDYVFVLNNKEDENDSSDVRSLIPRAFSFEQVSEQELIPFLPALDASTEITKDDSYSETVALAHAQIDSRLDAYLHYVKMAWQQQEQQEHHSLLTKATDFITIENKKKKPSRGSDGERGLGWAGISSQLDLSSRDLLWKLQEEGVLYTPHDTTCSVRYLYPVAPNGDCLFLSMEQILVQEKQQMTPCGIRDKAARFFAQHYADSTREERVKMDTTIKNLYFPSLGGGWGISSLQTRRFVARVVDRELLMGKILSLQEQYGYSYVKAAQMVYTRDAEPVCNAEAYCKYIKVGKPQKGEPANTHFLISLNYTKQGLVSIENELNRVSWGDDIVLEALATAYQRDIFVVLIGGGKMFFLPHRPILSKEAKKKKGGLSPWFLLMRSTGTDRGGDHYEPMYCQRLRGDANVELGTIGDEF